MKLPRLLRKRPDTQTRRDPDRSGQEVTALREFYGQELSAALYFHAGKRVIATAIAVLDSGVREERGQLLVADEPVSDEALGRMLFDVLLHFDPQSRPPIDLTRKPTDWPAYRASGAKSIRQFERDSIYVGVGTQGISLTACARWALRHTDLSGFAGGTPLFAEHDEVGSQLRRLVKGARLLIEADLL